MQNKRFFAGFLAAMMAMSTMAVPAFASSSDEPAIETVTAGGKTVRVTPATQRTASTTGTLEVFKITENDGAYQEAFGLKNESETREGIPNVDFTALKIADAVDVVGQDANGNTVAGLYYTNLDSDFLALAGSDLEGFQIDGVTYYTSNALNSAFQAIRNRLNGEHPGEDQINELVRDSSNAKQTKTTDDDGRVEFTDLALGLYLVAETKYDRYDEDHDETQNGDNVVIENPAIPFLAAIPMTNVARLGDYEVGTAWQYDVTVYPKNTTTNIVKKIITDKTTRTADDEEAEGALVDAKDYDIGDVMKQVIYADAPVQSMTHNDVDSSNDPNKTTDKDVVNRKYTEYKITDTMSDGLTFWATEAEANNSNDPDKEDPSTGKNMMPVVYIIDYIGDQANISDYRNGAHRETLVQGTDYSVSGHNTQTMTINFLSAGLAKLDARTQNSQVVVEFNTILNKDAKIGTVVENMNYPTLTWKHENTEEFDVVTKKVIAYTYEIDLTKIGLKDSANAVFEVFEDNVPNMVDGRNEMSSELQQIKWVKEADGVYHRYSPKTDAVDAEVVTQISPAHGQDKTVILKGLDASTYTFKEVKTEDHKSLLKETFDITLSAKKNDETGLPTGELESAILKTGKAATGTELKLKDDNKGIVLTNVQNYEVFKLHTGGVGTTMFYVGGLCILAMIAAVAVMGRKRIEE